MKHMLGKLFLLVFQHMQLCIQPFMDSLKLTTVIFYTLLTDTPLDATNVITALSCIWFS